MVGLRRVASTLLPRLAAEMGDTWFDETKPDQRTRVLGALTHELEIGTSGLDLRRGLALLQSEEETLRAKAVGAQVVKRPAPSFDIEDPDGDIRVDARMLTVDEHLKALSVIRTGIQPPLRPAERSVLEDMLHLGIWTLARPREYLELRLGDFQTGADGTLDVMIREYAGHGLKTPQATRRVPLSLLAPSDVNQRFRDCLDSRLDGGPTAAPELRRELFFAAPEGEDVGQYHDRLLGLLRQILQQVTGDPGVRAYSLRHTGANWLFMALESDGSWLWERLWSAHPAMKRYVLEGSALRMRLLGTTDRADRRAVLAITKLQGHLAAATTFMHYLHTTALMQLQAVYKFADSIPKAVLASAARISPSTLSEQGMGSSRAGLQHARTRAGWAVTQPSVPEPSQHLASNESQRWLSFGDLQVALAAHAGHQQPLAHIAAHFQRSEDSIRSIIETAAGISGWMASCGELNPASDLQANRTPDVRMSGTPTRWLG